MTLAFTICSINYLAQAHALGTSLEKHAPDCKFIIGLVDRLANPNLDQSLLPPFDILEVEKIGVNNLVWMNKNYNIIEFNTAVKPFYFKYFFEKYPEYHNFIYFDPDIVLFDSIVSIEHKLQDQNIILTPHIFEPINHDGKIIQENTILNYGLYNLGFLAVCKSKETTKFIQWWSNKLATLCRDNVCDGIFVDQLWCNLVPLFFEGVHIAKERGYNMAYWNLHERTLFKRDAKYFIKETNEPLIFFHFSGFNANIENNISTKQTRFDLSIRSDLVELYQQFDTDLKANHDAILRKINCEFGKPFPKTKKYQKLRKYLVFPFRRIIRFIENF